MLQLQEAGADLQAKKDCIALLRTSLEVKQAQSLHMQAEKQSSDASTQFLYSDVAECKPETFHARILRHMLVHFHRRFDWSKDMWRNNL